jgi:hypothetical protein
MILESKTKYTTQNMKLADLSGTNIRGHNSNRELTSLKPTVEIRKYLENCLQTQMNEGLAIYS